MQIKTLRCNFWRGFKKVQYIFNADEEDTHNVIEYYNIIINVD